MAKRDDEKRPSKADKEAQVRQAFRLQAEWCRSLGSPSGFGPDDGGIYKETAETAEGER